MADITTIAKTAATLSGRGNIPMPNRTYTDGSLQTQYFQSETQAYTQEMGQYASNVYIADCQGLNTQDFFAWRKVRLRSIRAAQAQTGSTMPGDWQRVYIIDPANYTYLPQGAMLKYADNTWIVYKDKNISAVLGSAIVRRCNAVINLLDWYGNIVNVPISYAKMETLGNATHATENTITSKNYIACICQLNEYSEQFTENTRIILGKTAYAMRGLDDFTREFTDDPDSVHLLTFTIERTELQAYDSAEYGVADYWGFSWEITVDFNNSMVAGNSQRLNVISRRNGAAVSSSEEYPIGYIYTSSDENVLTVDENGVVTAVGEGEAEITVALAQNPSKARTVAIEVPASESNYVAFTTTLPNVMHEGTSIVIGAQYFSNGVATNWPVNFTFSGAEEGAYSGEKTTIDFATMSSDDTHSSDNTYAGMLTDATLYKLTVYRASPKPLKIEIESQGYTAEATIYLVT